MSKQEEELMRSRSAKLRELGWIFNTNAFFHPEKLVSISTWELVNLSDENFEKRIQMFN